MFNRFCLMTTVAVAALTSGMPLALAAATSSAACLAASEPGLGGQQLPVVAGADPLQVSAELPFAPKSFYVADGYAVKVFAAAAFGGDSELAGSALDIEQAASYLQKTPGGHFYDVGSLHLSDNVGSFACIPAGKVFRSDAIRARGTPRGTAVGQPLPFLVYEGKTFATDGNTYHGVNAEAVFTAAGGKNLLTVERRYYLADGHRVTMDLDTRVMTFEVIDGAYPHGVVATQTVAPMQQRPGVIDFAYQGAVRTVLETLSLLQDNPAGGGPGASPVTVPSLELKSLIEALRENAGFL